MYVSKDVLIEIKRENYTTYNEKKVIIEPEFYVRGQLRLQQHIPQEGNVFVAYGSNAGRYTCTHL